MKVKQKMDKAVQVVSRRSISGPDYIGLTSCSIPVIPGKL